MKKGSSTGHRTLVPWARDAFDALARGWIAAEEAPDAAVRSTKEHRTRLVFCGWVDWNDVARRRMLGRVWCVASDASDVVFHVLELSGVASDATVHASDGPGLHPVQH